MDEAESLAAEFARAIHEQDMDAFKRLGPEALKKAGDGGILRHLLQLNQDDPDPVRGRRALAAFLVQEMEGLDPFRARHLAEQLLSSPDDN